MPEYMTKSEPVDKKPYIVYTDEKGILYSNDPNADIPGGGGSVKCYLINSDAWETPLSTTDLVVRSIDGTVISLESDTLTSEGQTADCISFVANVGGIYAASNGDSTLVSGTIAYATDPGSSIPSDNSSYPNTLSFVAPNIPFVALVEVSK